MDGSKSYTTMALDQNQEQDFLGKMFMRLDLGNRSAGQFFTPYHVCELKYYGVDTEYIGTIFTELRDKTISDNSSFYENSTIEETVDYLESDWELWLFWVIWIIVIGLCVFGFYYIDNEWIEN